MLAHTTALAANTRGLLLCILMCSVQVSADMAKLVEKGVNSFKFFFAYKHEGLMVRDEVGRLSSKPPWCLPGWLQTLGSAAAVMQTLWGVQCLAALSWVHQLALQHVSRAAAPPCVHHFWQSDL